VLSLLLLLLVVLLLLPLLSPLPLLSSAVRVFAGAPDCQVGD
jgi:hypothetical protein